MIVEIRRLHREQNKAMTGLDAGRQSVVARPYNAKIEKLQDKAKKAFAAVNGWSAASTANWARKLIPPDKRDGEWWWEWGYYVGQVISDHNFVCKEMGTNRVTAVVCQPYHDCLEEAKVAAERLGLEVHTPPDPRASIWYPGHTRFYVFTRPGVTVRWLKEQVEWQQVEEPETQLS